MDSPFCIGFDVVKVYLDIAGLWGASTGITVDFRARPDGLRAEHGRETEQFLHRSQLTSCR